MRIKEYPVRILRVFSILDEMDKSSEIMLGATHPRCHLTLYNIDKQYSCNDLRGRGLSVYVTNGGDLILIKKGGLCHGIFSVRTSHFESSFRIGYFKREVTRKEWIVKVTSVNSNVKVGNLHHVFLVKILTALNREIILCGAFDLVCLFLIGRIRLDLV